MKSHGDSYKGDGRTIQQIGDELGLTPVSIQRVQQDATTPDKIAMNVWRTICPTMAARLEVGSITTVPRSTIENIHSKLANLISLHSKSIYENVFITLGFARLCLSTYDLDIKKVRSDIATNLRLAQFRSKQGEKKSIIQYQVSNETDSEDSSSDHGEVVSNSESLLQTEKNHSIDNY